MSNTSSSYSYNKCQPYISSDCVQWVAGDVPCLGICNGASLTQAQVKITEAICELLGDVDMSSVVIPDCLKTLWASQNPTIQTLFQFILTNACAQQAQINSIDSEIATIDPLVTVDYKCCSSNPCVTTGQVKLSVALQNIVNCLCDLNSQISNFASEIEDLNGRLDSVNQQLGIINAFITTQTTTNSTFATTIQGLQNTTSCLKTGILGASSFPINVSGC